MSDTNSAEIELLVVCGARKKLWHNFCPTTTRQEFISQMCTWLGNEFPQNYTALFYNKPLRQMIQLDENATCYLVQIFDFISSEIATAGVQPMSTDDNRCITLFISDNNSSIASHSSSEAFERGFQLHVNKVIAENLNSVSSNNSPWPTLDDLLNNDSFDKSLFDSTQDIQEDNEPSVVVQHISPTTNIQFRLADHIHMELDVCSTPRRLTYASNMGKKGKSKLAYLRGIRRPTDQGKQIRPIILIPDIVLQWLQENSSLVLVVACVRETLQDGILTWWIDKHNEFRRKGCQRNISGTNPLEIPLTLGKIVNGTYKLEVILTRIPGHINQVRKGELVHALDVRIVEELHPAQHNSESSRLVFIISSFGIPQLNTIGCSDFIREPSEKKKAASTNNKTNLETPVAQS